MSLYLLKAKDKYGPMFLLVNAKNATQARRIATNTTGRARHGDGIECIWETPKLSSCRKFELNDNDFRARVVWDSLETKP